MLALLGRNSSKRSVVRRAGSSSSKTSSKTSSSSTSNKPLTRGTPLLVEAVTVSWHHSLVSQRAVEIYNLLTSLVSQRAVATLVRGGCRLPQKFSPAHASNPCSRALRKHYSKLRKIPHLPLPGCVPTVLVIQQRRLTNRRMLCAHTVCRLVRGRAVSLSPQPCRRLHKARQAPNPGTLWR